MVIDNTHVCAPAVAQGGVRVRCSIMALVHFCCVPMTTLPPFNPRNLFNHLSFGSPINWTSWISSWKESVTEEDLWKYSLTQSAGEATYKERDDWRKDRAQAIRAMTKPVDVGFSSSTTYVLVLLIAVLQGFLGSIFRVWNGRPAFSEHRQNAVVLNIVSTTVSGWFIMMQVVSIFRRWRRAWKATAMIGSALLMDSSIAEGMPVYVDLRIPGNVDAWVNCMKYVSRFYSRTAFSPRETLGFTFGMLVISVNFVCH